MPLEKMKKVDYLLYLYLNSEKSQKFPVTDRKGMLRSFHFYTHAER